jgi:DNA polymerase I-like protein with 3'-5' exonuclease and polymerase domains
MIELAFSLAKTARTRKLPCVPITDWKPKPFPNLSDAKIIQLDLETYDPHLVKRGDQVALGPGWARHDGHIVGIGVGTEDGYRTYFPMRHEVCPEQNLNPDHVLAWARDQLSGPQPKIGANILYDVGWCREEGVTVGGDWIDVQFAEALLTEDEPTNLDHLGEKYCGEGKYSGALYRWCAQAYGGEENGGQRANIYRAPPSLVGPYAEGDVDLPLRVFREQWPKLCAQNLQSLFALECGLLPLMLEMRFAGVSVDVARAEQLRDRLWALEKSTQRRLDTLAGCAVNVNEPETIAKAFDRAGIAYPRTAKTNAPSFKNDFLESVHTPLAFAIRKVRKLAKLRGTFIESYILNSHVNGKLHGQFHTLRGPKDEDSDEQDQEGARSGRMSSSTPNLTNIPSRDKEIAPLIRGLFVPDSGHQRIRKHDYSQIEYRWFVHFARGPGADDARALFNSAPATDFHEWTLDLIAPVAGWDISTPDLRKYRRKPIKNINFGLLYGMGIAKFARLYQLTLPQAEELYAAYHAGVPFAKPTMRFYTDQAAKFGEISTVLGRKRRFEKWEPREFEHCARNGVQDGRPQWQGSLPYARAVKAYGTQDLKRAETFKALNGVLQGSAADMAKTALFRCWKEGVFARTGVPRLFVHDEFVFSDPGGQDEAFEEMQHVMETAIPLSIPVRADGDAGPDWGHCKAIT